MVSEHTDSQQKERFGLSEPVGKKNCSGNGSTKLETFSQVFLTTSLGLTRISTLQKKEKLISCLRKYDIMFMGKCDQIGSENEPSQIGPDEIDTFVRVRATARKLVDSLLLFGFQKF